MTDKLRNKLFAEARKVLPFIDLRQRHVSLIVRKNTIISVGYNHKKTHPIAHQFGHRFNCIHSELHAIVRADMKPSELRQCLMYNIRFLRCGRVGLSRPCGPCRQMLQEFGVDVVYTNEMGKFVTEKEC